MNTRRLTAAAVAGLAVLLTSCTTPPAQDPAAQAAIAYYTSIDTGTPENCDLTWSYRAQPAKLADCKANPVGGRRSITSAEVTRTVPFPGPTGGPGKALTVTMTLKDGSAVYAVAMAEADGKWFWVKEESLSRPPATDDELTAALA